MEMIKMFGNRERYRGPDLSESMEHTLDLSGTRIRYMTPQHNDKLLRSNTPSGICDINDDSFFWKNGGNPSEGQFFEFSWEYRKLFKGIVPIWGDRGRLGRLRLIVSVGIHKRCASLLNNKNWLTAIHQNIPWNALQEIKCVALRENWRIQQLDAVPFVHYDEHVIDQCKYPEIYQYWLAPISDKHYVRLTFNQQVLSGNINLYPVYDEIVRSILDSVRIEWSPMALKQQAEAKVKWPEQKLPETALAIVRTYDKWYRRKKNNSREREGFSLDTLFFKESQLLEESLLSEGSLLPTERELSEGKISQQNDEALAVKGVVTEKKIEADSVTSDRAKSDMETRHEENALSAQNQLSEENLSKRHNDSSATKNDEVEKKGKTYPIVDEPNPGTFSSMTVAPKWPLLACVFGGAPFFAWTWAILNGVVMGSPTLKREIITIVFGCILVLGGMYGLQLAMQTGAIDKSLHTYAENMLLTVGLVISYAVFVMQSRAFDVFTSKGLRVTGGAFYSLVLAQLWGPLYANYIVRHLSGGGIEHAISFI